MHGMKLHSTRSLRDECELHPPRSVDSPLATDFKSIVIDDTPHFLQMPCVECGRKKSKSNNYPTCHSCRAAQVAGA